MHGINLRKTKTRCVITRVNVSTRSWIKAAFSGMGSTGQARIPIHPRSASTLLTRRGDAVTHLLCDKEHFIKEGHADILTWEHIIYNTLKHSPASCDMPQVWEGFFGDDDQAYIILHRVHSLERLFQCRGKTTIFISFSACPPSQVHCSLHMHPLATTEPGSLPFTDAEISWFAFRAVCAALDVMRSGQLIGAYPCVLRILRSARFA